jgi:hypothetical protein
VLDPAPPVVLDPDFFLTAFGSGGGGVAFLAPAFGSSVDAATLLGPCPGAGLFGACCATSGGSPIAVQPPLLLRDGIRH